MDLSKLSDDELMQMAGGAKPSSGPNYSAMSDEQLLQLAGGTAQPNDPWASVSQPQDTIQEEHPDVRLKDRLILKNLATSPEAQVRYLAKEHPHLEIVADDSGQIKMKRPGEAQYRVLDPDTGVFSSPSEFAKDVGDIGYDVLSGIGTSAATAAGGVGGFFGGAGVGALPGAVAAGAGASAGLEGLRQGLGSALGIEDNFDPTQIALSGVTGAASPLLFGTGAGVKDIAGKSLIGKLAGRGGAAALTDDAATAALKAQSGIPGRMVSKVVEKFAPSVGSALSGAPKQAVMDMAENVDAIRKFEADPSKLEDLIDDNAKDLISKISRQETKVYEDLTEHIAEKSGGKIDVKNAIKPFWDAVQESKAAWEEGGTPALKAEYDDALKEFKRIWGPARGKLVKGKVEIDPKFYTKSPKILQKIKDELAEVADYKKRYPLGNAQKAPPSDLLSRVAGKSYGELNKSIENAAEGSSSIRKRLQEIIEDKQFAYKEFSEPGKAFKRFQAASKGKAESKQLAEKIKLLDKKYGTTLDKTRGTANAIASFGKNEGFFSTRQTLGGAIGGLAGYAALNQAGGQQSFGGIPGYVPGAVIGAALTSPRMLLKVLEAAKKTSGTGSKALSAQKKINDIIMRMGMSQQFQTKKEQK